MIKNIIKNNSSIVRNFGYLSILQIFNILLPLATYPYLIRILGADIYGTIIYAQAIIMYFSLIINFGFNISGTKEVAENINDKEKIAEIVSSIYIIKFGLFFVSIFILISCLYFVLILREIGMLICITFSATLSELLFPQWYFQGVDKMKYITLLALFTRLLFTILIFIIIDDESDYLYVPFISGIGILFSAVISLYILIYKEHISFYIPSKVKLKFYFKESLPLFISAASVQLYVNANRILVGVFLGMSEVAYYDLGEKVLRLIKIPVGMLGQSAFPTLSREKNIKKINRIMFLGVSIALALIILVFVFSEQIVFLLGGENMYNAIVVMRILSISAFMVAFSQFLGTSRLIVFGFKKEFTQIISSSGVLFFLGVAVLYKLDYINIYSLALLAVSVEFSVTMFMFVVNYRKKLLI